MGILFDRTNRVIVLGARSGYGGVQLAGMRAAGTQVVALTSPGRGGTGVDGLPVFDTVHEATKATGGDTAMIYVPAAGVRDAVLECVEAGVTLAAVAAEFVPLQDAAWSATAARRHGVWLVGPNFMGIATPGEAMLGAFPFELIQAGSAGVMGRSGSLLILTASLLSARGVGISTCVHIGGDEIAGRNPDEYLELFLRDEQTAVVVYLAEIGGAKDYAMLDRIRAAGKPVVVLIVGRHAPHGKRMGHAGALIEHHRDGAQAKSAAFAEAGAIVANTVVEVPDLTLEAVCTP